MTGDITLIQKHFELSKIQLDQFSMLPSLYEEWNAKINVISRKDQENLMVNHVLHSLAIAKVISFTPETTVLDLGTGGGFPGIPLSIVFPDVRFTLIDGTRKKITVVNEVIESLGLKNAIALQVRAEEHKSKYDFVVSRAVARLDKLWELSRPLIRKENINATPNGLLALKGGDLREELNEVRHTYKEVHDLSDFYDLPYFETKKIVYVQS